MLGKRNAYLSQIEDEMRQYKQNSPANQASLMAAAGQNADLLGTSGVAGAPENDNLDDCIFEEVTEPIPGFTSGKDVIVGSNKGDDSPSLKEKTSLTPIISESEGTLMEAIFSCKNLELGIFCFAGPGKNKIIYKKNSFLFFNIKHKQNIWSNNTFK